MKLRLGTRGSALALFQSRWFAGQLAARGHKVDLVRIVTEGDTRPTDSLPGEGMFVTAIAESLARGEIDVAVHSAKDVPLEESRELVIAAFPQRADPRDALVTRFGHHSLETLPAGCAVGTDSPRRAGFVRAARADLRMVPLHGNVDSRLRRLDEGEVDAVVIACAGLDRLDRGDRIDVRLEPETMPPAPAQGALAVQARRSDAAVLRALADLDRPAIRMEVEAERRVLDAVGGSCRAPVGALARVSGDRFHMIVGGVNSDGSDMTVERFEGPAAEMIGLAEAAGRRLVGAVALR